MLCPLLAWSWSGHGQLTALALGYALAQMVIVGKKAVLEKLAKFAEKKTSHDPFAKYGTTSHHEEESLMKSAMKSMMKDQSNLGEVVQRVVRVFGDLPSRVQSEDAHWGNVPGLKEINPFKIHSQTRHFMRTFKETSVDEAYSLSRKYIWDHAYYSWYSFAWIASRPQVDPYAHYSTLINGIDNLAKILHTIEDSYAPGHVRRSRGNWIIRHIYYWDSQNRSTDERIDWPGHSDLDDPENDLSAPYYQEARRSAGEFILTILSNSNQPQNIYVSNMSDVLQRRFMVSWDGKGDRPISPRNL